MQIERKASVIFSDASIIIRDEFPDASVRLSWADEKARERKFKREVFARIVQTLNRLGWVCVLPDKEARNDPDEYGIRERMRRCKRLCSKGDLKGELHLSGSCLKFEMFQNVNAPDRPDHDGRYQGDKEHHMPYLIRLEMERTRRRIRNYLCSVFTGYHFDVAAMDKYQHRIGVGYMTAMEAVEKDWRNSGHFVERLGRPDGEHRASNNKSADGGVVRNGERVWYLDRKGRWITGIAYYRLGPMWNVVSGRYTRDCQQNNYLHVSCPDDLRVKRNSKLRRSRIEHLMAHAAAAMKFERAAQLRDLLNPKAEPLYMILNTREDVYFRQDYSGYTRDTTHAGKYTRAELKPYLGDADVKDDLRAVPIQSAA